MENRPGTSTCVVVVYSSRPTPPTIACLRNVYDIIDIHFSWGGGGGGEAGALQKSR